MLRTCPKCGDFYADPALTFCTADGMPLADVEPQGDGWREGARVVEEKAKARRRLERRLRWRRFMWSVVTTIVVTLVVCVLAANTYIYLGPKRERAALDTPSTPTPTPTETPTPTPTETPTPTPTPVYKISGRVVVGRTPLPGVLVSLDGAKFSSTKTDAGGNYSFDGLPEGGSYNVTPAAANVLFTPAGRSFDRLTGDATADFSASERPECDFTDERVERKNINGAFGGDWRRLHEADRERIVAEHTPRRAVRGDRRDRLVLNDNRRGALVSNDNRRGPLVLNDNRRPPLVTVEATLGLVTAEISFPRMCRASVTVRAEWQVTRSFDGRAEPVPPVRASLQFDCSKSGTTWRCVKARPR